MPDGMSSPPRPEEMALTHYSVLGYRGIWSENLYWGEVMALLFWDIFNGMSPGFFLDRSVREVMPSLYRKRADEIRYRVRELRRVASVSQEIRDSYLENRGKPCRDVWNWDRYSLDSLCAGVDSISRDQVCKIMIRLLADFYRNRSGLPDLFFFSPKPLFVEVKASSDSLRKNQVEWLRFLVQTLRLPVEVLLADHSNTKIDSVKKLFAAEGFSIKVSRMWAM
jgi:hypothetical protein